MTKTYEIRVDRGANRIDIVLRGRVCNASLQQLYTDIRFAVADLQQDFSVITDLTKAQFGYLSGIPTFKKITRFLQDNGVGTIVRITDRPKIIVRQMERLTSMIDNYHPIYASSRTEALELVSSPEQKIIQNQA